MIKDDVHVDRVLAESQKTIKEESQKIAASVTRILMLGGPKFVEAILTSFLVTNQKISEQLNVSANINFEETPK